MSTIFLANARVVDGTAPEPSAPQGVVIEGERIREVSPGARAPARAATIDLAGKVLMPGLIDCHVHTVAVEASLGRNATLPDSLVMARSMRLLGEMLMRGFTTVRDVGGGDHGQVMAQAEGLFPGPRLVVSGKALSQSGGHGDFRGPFDPSPPRFSHRLGALGRLCDGVHEVRKAAREEIKAGARFIKIMANGGVASPTDPIHFLGFSREEILAAVEEAANAGTYVAAHLYTDAGIRRAVECGVHSLEHCNLITTETARFAAERGAIACPTLVTYDALSKEGEALGIGAEAVAKVDDVRLAGMESLLKMREAGLPMAYGTDLLGAMHRHQSDEFVIRGQVLPAQEVIASTTHVAARLCRMEGLIGTVAPGAYADLIVVDGDPLRDLSLLTGQGRHMPMIMQGGAWMKGADAAAAILAALAAAGAAGFALGLILLPLVLVAWLAFFRQEIPAFPPEGYTLRWFAAIPANRSFASGFLVSLQVSLAATAIGLLLAVPASLALAGRGLRLRAPLATLLTLPLIVPGVVLGAALYVGELEAEIATEWPLLGSLGGLIAAHTLIVIPWAVRLLSASLGNLDPTIGEAARNLGATPFTAFRRVTLPAIRPGLVAATLFGFVTSFGNLEASLFLVAPGMTTLPIAVLQYLAWKIDPTVAAVSLLQILAIGLAMLVTNRFVKLSQVV